MVVGSPFSEVLSLRPVKLNFSTPEILQICIQSPNDGF